MSRPRYFDPAWIKKSAETLTTDVCIYGGTAAGVVAAKSAAKQGLSVVILQPGQFLGGMTTGGLGETDFGHKAVILGMSRQFYRDLGKHYGHDEEWKFEPSAAQKIIDGYAKESGAVVRFGQYLQSVEMTDGKIVSLRTMGGLSVKAKIFIDCTYEGDLMALAGVSYHVGREANSVYGETVNGIQVHNKHQFNGPVDPYIKPGDPSSGVLPGVDPRDAAPDGSGDTRVQAYCFRMCMSDDPKNLVPWQKPEGFDESLYELARRWYNAEKDQFNEVLQPHDPITAAKMDRLFVRSKTDTNNHGAVSSDFIGMSWTWADADYLTREKLFQAHVTYQQGLYWFLANDPQIPQRYRTLYNRWGLAKDEFTSTNNWPHQLYVREARRMVSDYVLTEADVRWKRKAEDPVGFGSYNMDSHNCQRIVRDGQVMNEGDVQLPPAGPYGVSYRSIVPRAKECRNLLVPVCLAASHIAYGSVRMEPVFMGLGESSGVAAALAIKGNTDVQAVPYKKLREQIELP